MSAEAEKLLQGWVLDDAVLPNARVRQGDLIRFETSDDDLRKLAIVVTADCDLQQKKHARILTFVPVVPATIVMEHYLIPEDCERKKELIERFVCNRLDIPFDSDEITKQALFKAKLIESNQDPSSALAIAVNFVLHEVDRISLSYYNTLMSEMRVPPRKIDSFRDQLRSRGDLLILPDAQSLGVRGHIAWVRQLWQTSASSVALRTSEIATRPGERIARLDSPFRYRLTQLIAQVFSDIGLPDLPNSIDQILVEAYS